MHGDPAGVVFGATGCANMTEAAPGASHQNPADGSGLTAREAMVMTLIAEGLSTRLAARRLCIGPRTVEKHVEHALRKLQARSRVEAVAILRTLGGG